MANFEITRDGVRSRVTLGERLAAADIPVLRPALLQEIDAGAGELVFDLAKTVSIDSSGIGLLIAANNSLQPREGFIRLLNVSPDIFRLLQSMRLVERLRASAATKELSA